ncbi:MAG: peptidylprolyl isomerase [Isosphaeraceae bacterium]
MRGSTTTADDPPGGARVRDPGGDPKGDGTGGPSFSFDDEFNPQAIFSGSGQLAMANSGKDTNGSQFFVTVTPQRGLDFNHTIWGQLVRGNDVLLAINNAPNGGNAGNNRPYNTITITSASLISDAADGVLMLSAPAGSNAATHFTVTATDTQGFSDTRTFTATAVKDTTNDPPILGPVSNQTILMNSTLTLPLTSIDLENDPVTYSAAITTSPANSTATIQGNSLVFKPTSGFTGQVKVSVGVKQTDAVTRGTTSNLFDTHVITITVVPQQMQAEGYGTSATQGAAFSGFNIARFSALGNLPASNFTAAITWGDGTTGTGTVVARADGAFDVIAPSKAFAKFGTFTAVTKITDTSTGAQVSASGGFSVADAPSTLTLAAQPPITGPLSVSGVIATFQDNDPGSTLTGMNATIAWGNGTPVAAVISPRGGGVYDIVGSKSFASAGSYALTVKVTTPDGTSASASGTISLGNAPGNPNPSAPARVASASIARNRKGVVTSISLTFSSPLDANSAGKVSNYSLLIGPARRQTVKRLLAAGYDAASMTVKLTPPRNFKITARTQLRIRGVVDTQGRALDGNKDGKAGGDYLANVTNKGVAQVAS